MLREEETLGRRTLSTAVASSRDVVRGCYEKKRRCGVAPFFIAVASSSDVLDPNGMSEDVAARRG